MALIDCPECGGKVSDKAPACIHCGYPLQEARKDEKRVQYCPYCGAKNDVDSAFCGYCGKSFSKQEFQQLTLMEADQESTDIMDYKKDVDLSVHRFRTQPDVAELQQIQIQQQQLQIMQQQQMLDAQARCPKCGSISLSGNKQGFGIGKAAVGIALVGGVGLLAGGLGANNTIVTCLNCGYKFKL